MFIMKDKRVLNKNLPTTGSPSRNVATDRSETRNDINENTRHKTGNGAAFGKLSEIVGKRRVAGSGSGLHQKIGTTGSDTDGQLS
jgi:hypothetical protein